MMFNIKQISAVLTVAAIVLAGSAKPVFGQYYGQGENKNQIIVDKKIRPLNETTLYDNIDRSQKVFLDGDNLEFNIKVENNGQQDLANITVKDILPLNLELIFFPGTYNKATNTIQWTVDSLRTGESKTYIIRARVKGVKAAEKKVNTASVSADNTSDQDKAVYYVGVKTVPVTGNEDILINSALGLMGISLAFGLRKFARGY